MSANPSVVLRVKDSKMAVRIPYARHRRPELALHDLTGPGTRHPVWDDERAAWLLPRTHAETVILGPARRFREVTVFQYGDPAVLCNRSCQTAQTSVPVCECSCAGAGHGMEHRPSDAEAASARTGTVLGARVGIAAAFVVPGFRVGETTHPTRTEDGILRRYIVRHVGGRETQGRTASTSLNAHELPSRTEGFADVADRRLDAARLRITSHTPDAATAPVR